MWSKRLRASASGHPDLARKRATHSGAKTRTNHARPASRSGAQPGACARHTRHRLWFAKAYEYQLYRVEVAFAEGPRCFEAVQNSQNSPAKGLTALGEARGTSRGDLRALARFWRVGDSAWRWPACTAGRAEELPPPSSWADARPRRTGRCAEELPRSGPAAIRTLKNSRRRRRAAGWAQLF